MTLLAALLTAAAVAALPRRGAHTRLVRRPRALPARRSFPVPVLAAGTVAAGLVVVTVGGARAGVVAAAVVGGSTVLRVRRGRPAAPDPAEAALAIDLLAGCLAAGAGLATALRAAASAAPAARRFATVADALDDGAEPAAAWSAVGGAGILADAARTCVRAGASGAAVADELRRVARRARVTERTDARRRVQRASVWVVLPLGVCFLPAFVLVGVVPLVLSAVPQILS